MQFNDLHRGDRQQTLGPEDVFSYMYAIFYSPTYRERYTEFLRITSVRDKEDTFPRKQYTFS